MMEEIAGQQLLPARTVHTQASGIPVRAYAAAGRGGGLFHSRYLQHLFLPVLLRELLSRVERAGKAAGVHATLS